MILLLRTVFITTLLKSLIETKIVYIFKLKSSFSLFFQKCDSTEEDDDGDETGDDEVAEDDSEDESEVSDSKKTVESRGGKGVKAKKSEGVKFTNILRAVLS